MSSGPDGSPSGWVTASGRRALSGLRSAARRLKPGSAGEHDSSATWIPGGQHSLAGSSGTSPRPGSGRSLGVGRHATPPPVWTPGALAMGSGLAGAPASAQPPPGWWTPGRVRAIAGGVTVAVAGVAGAASYRQAAPSGGHSLAAKRTSSAVSPVPLHSGAPSSPAAASLAAPAPLAPAASAPPAPGPAAAWVVQENARPGTGAWALSKASHNHQIEGYADHVSIPVGSAVQLLVSTTSPTFRVEAYRMGFYGGARGRLVWTSAAIKGVAQPGYTVAPGVNMVETQWSPSLTVQTDASWPQGNYLFKLVAADGFQSYVPLTLRDDASQAAIVVSSDVTTWQAYNLYGGYDLYNGPKGYPTRSRVVSFDRPYFLAPSGGDSGSGDFLGNEENLVALVESLGMDVTYSTDVDLHQHPDLMLHHRAFLSLGHDEYYSLAMRNALLAGLDHGVNLVFFGANAIYRHIRFESSPLGPDRHEVDYKDANEDPVKSGPDVTPVAWRSPPNNLPESQIMANFYQCNPVVADLVVSDPASWVYAGAGVGQGTVLAGVVGTEYDRYDPKNPGPKNVAVLAHSPLVCQGRADYADMTYYTAPSGAGVFATGTLLWIPKLAPCTAPCVGATLARITQNVLAVFAAGPAGKTHPSAANYATLPTAPGSPPSGTG